MAQLISEQIGGIPVALTNDANAAAIGEMTYGAARGMKDFIVITLGTGVGSGIVIGGNLVYGHDGFAGELGHVIMRRNNGRPCGCGRQGCLETYASATGVARTAREYLEIRKDESLLRDLDPDEITSKDVFDAAMKNDKLALEIFEFTGNILGEAFADAVAFSSPEAIILFGGLTKAGDLIMNPIKRSMDKNMLKVYEGKTKTSFLSIERKRCCRIGSQRFGLGSERVIVFTGVLPRIKGGLRSPFFFIYHLIIRDMNHPCINLSIAPNVEPTPSSNVMKKRNSVRHAVSYTISILLRQ